jgi:hypothetical protein
MPYIGQQPTNVAFLTDTFNGNGSTTAFTLSAAPASTNSILVAVSGVLQDPSTYSVSGTTLTFSGAPPSGTGNISVRFLGVPASGVTNTAYRTVTEFTATAGQTTFSVPSYTVGFVDVYRNGVMLGSADYTATSGVSVVLANGCTAGDLVEVISFQVSSVLNAVQSTGGTFSGNVLFASGNGIWNSNGNVGIGVTPSAWNSSYKALQIGSQGSVSQSVSAIYVATNWYQDTSGTNRYLTSAPSVTFGTDGNNFVVRQAPSGTAGNAITFTQAMTLDDSGNLLVGLTSATSGGGVLQVSNGITFPATQSASTNANTLDDYEEGTWTPSLLNGGTLNVLSARYVKIGQQVTVSFYVNTVSPTNNGSEFRIGGLPFTPLNQSNMYFAGSFGYAGDSNLNGWMPITGVGISSIYFHVNTSSTTTMTNANYISAASGSIDAFIITLTYFTA